MGCVNATNARQTTVVLVEFQQQRLALPLANFEADFRRSIETRFPPLRSQSWYLLDPLSARPIRTQTDYQQFCTAVKSQPRPVLLVQVEAPISLTASHPFSRLFQAVCALWTQNRIVCSGVFIGDKYILLPICHKSSISEALCLLQGEVKVAISNKSLWELPETETLLTELDVTDTRTRETVAKLEGLPLKPLEKDVKSGSSAFCFHYQTADRRLREWKGSLADVSNTHINVDGQLPGGSYGSPLFLDTGEFAGILLPARTAGKETFLRAGRLIESLAVLSKSVPGLQSLLPKAVPAHTAEEIQLEVSHNEEGNYSVGLENPPFSLQHRSKLQSAQPEAAMSSPQLSFDYGDVPPMPESHQVPALNSLDCSPYAHIVMPVSGGTEVWRLAKSGFSLKRQICDFDLPRKSSSVDTQVGLVIAGGEDKSGRKAWVWDEGGIRAIGDMQFPHSLHTSVQLVSSVLVISGEQTEQAELLSLSTLSFSVVQPLPKRRFLASACAVGQSALFLTGGYIGPQAKPTRSILEYRSHSDTWLKVPFKLTAPMVALGSFFIAPKSLLVFGGKNAQGIASAEAYIVDVQSGMRVASLHLPEAATFARTQATRDDESFIVFSDQTHQFEYDAKRQRFYLLSVS